MVIEKELLRFYKVMGWKGRLVLGNCIYLIRVMGSFVECGVYISYKFRWNMDV